MENVFADLVGNPVKIESKIGDGAAWGDEGILEHVDNNWVRLRKGKDEIMCFPVRHVRYLKVTVDVPRALHLAQK